MQLIDAGTPATLAASVRARFHEVFGEEPTTVGRAPGRVNLIGEHTDYNAGLCLPVALPHATYAAVRLREDGVIRLRSAQADDTWEGTLADVGPGHPRGWPAYVAGVLWALADVGYAVPGVDVVIDSTVPVGAGLSSSAAIECSVAAAVVAALGGSLTDEVRELLVPACMRAEIEVAGAPTGGMDQAVSLFAQEGRALLLDFQDGSRTQVSLPLHEAGLAFLVVDTRVSHALVDGGYASRRADCERAVAQLGISSLRDATLADLERLDDDRVRRRVRHVVTEIERVEEVVAAAAHGSWQRVGDLFVASHASMRDDYEISCEELDLVVETALAHGALGARMTGGGFGGSAIVLAPVDRREEIGDAIVAAFAAASYGEPGLLSPDPSAGVSLE
ncbi:MAG: galactokinase [Nocardioidaceae bacterium]